MLGQPNPLSTPHTLGQKSLPFGFSCLESHLSHTVFPDGCTGPLFPKLHLPQSGAVSCHSTQETRDLWEAPAYAEPQKKLSLAFLLPKTFSEEEQRKACQDLATLTSLRHSLFQAKAVPESDESKLATQAAAASVFPLLPSERSR